MSGSTNDAVCNISIRVYASRRLRDSAPCPGLLASACTCTARKWRGENSTHRHHMPTPIIALEASSHSPETNNIGRMMQCVILAYARRGDLAPCPGLLASACTCTARKWCGENSTHCHHMFTPIIALETSSHLRGTNNIGRMMRCAAYYNVTRRGDSAPCPSLLASACTCTACKWRGDNSTLCYFMFTPIIGITSTCAFSLSFSLLFLV